MNKTSIIGTIIGLAIGGIVGYIFGQKSVAAKYETENELNKEVMEHIRDRYKEKEKECEEKIAAAEKKVENLQELRREDWESFNKRESTGLPLTEEEIMAHNELHNRWLNLEFITEEEFEFDDGCFSKDAYVIYKDGNIAYAETGALVDDPGHFVGNMLNGMGPENVLRFVRDNEVYSDYKFIYVDHDAPAEPTPEECDG